MNFTNESAISNFDGMDKNKLPTVTELAEIQTSKPEITIESSRKKISEILKEIWNYRELGLILTIRDIKVRYKQTSLGVIWAFIQPLFTMIVFVVFVGRMGKIDQEIENYTLFVLAGIIPWTFFANGVTLAANSLLANERLITKVYFPRIWVPISSIGVSFIDFLFAMILLVGFMLYYSVTPGIQILLLPLITLMLVLASAGCGVLLSALIVAQRDLKHGINIIVQLWMFATPCIFINIAQLSEQTQMLLSLNPVFGLIDAFKSVILNREISIVNLSISSLIVFVISVISLFTFKRIDASLADKI
jgi:lipopolysaccharide transport system permease protein